MAEEDGTPQELIDQLERLRQDYLARLPGELDALDELVRKMVAEGVSVDHLASLHQRLHKLAGSGGTFGLPALSLAARSVEQRVKRLLDAESSGVDKAYLQALASDIAGLADAAATPGSAHFHPAPTESVPVGPSCDANRIWLVNEDAFQGRELAAQLESFGYEVRLFSSLRDADRAVSIEKAPDLVIMDVVFEVEQENATEALNRYEDLKGLSSPLLFVSSRDEFESRIRAAKLGAQGYLLKPLDVPRLVNRMVQIFEHRNAPPERILIVDDDQDLAAHYRLVLMAAGMNADVLDDPRQIMERVAAHRPELVLMDLHMPEYTGPELAGLIRQHETWDSLPIVYLSAETDLAMRVDAMSRGADDFLTKPVSDAQLVAAVRSRVARSRQLDAQIARDSLTGLLKHSAIKEAIEVEVSRARRTGKPLTVALLDIDHFKAVNDTYGHATGDLVISSVAMLLRQRLRSTDIIGRYGGEEFAIALPDCELEHGKMLLDDIRRRFQDIRFTHEGQAFICTLSAGVAAPGQSGMLSGAQLLNNADEALYVAKRNGRNQVCVAEDDPRRSLSL